MAAARSVPEETWNLYVDLRIAGAHIMEACARTGINFRTAKKFDCGDPRSSGFPIWAVRCAKRSPWVHIKAATQPGSAEARLAAAKAELKRAERQERQRITMAKRRGRPVETETIDAAPPDATGEAKTALADFELFRRRYFGHVSLQWHIDAAVRLVDILEEAIANGDRRFVLLNVAPGSGKTTMLHDLAAWVTCRNRAIRGGNVSRAEPLAVRNTARLKRSFERISPVRAKPGDLSRGLAVDATATLAGDYGAFQPEGRADLWTREAFIVVQADGQAIVEKEPTWSSYGLESAILGNRLDLIIGDDLVDKGNTRTPEARQLARDSYGDEVEKRLDDGGLCVAAGQRMHIDDLYRWLRDMPGEDFSLDDMDVIEGVQTLKYTHIVYPAHDVNRCKGIEADHSRRAAPYPEGCLLDPIRLPWRLLSAERARGPAKYELIYNQDDSFEADDALARSEWIEECWDHDRVCWQRPAGLEDPICVITADPSPTKWWAVQSWVYQPAGDDGLGGRRYLLDSCNEKMEAPDLLDMNYATKEYHGLLEDCRKNYLALGLRLTHVIVEVNAAQRFLLQYAHIKRWYEMHNIRVLPHTTSVRKLDLDLGVTGLLQPQWEFARVRLPGGDRESRYRVRHLPEQAVRWPVEPNDQIMAQWFLEANLPSLYTPPVQNNLKAWRPSWLDQMAVA